MDITKCVILCPLPSGRHPRRRTFVIRGTASLLISWEHWRSVAQLRGHWMFGRRLPLPPPRNLCWPLKPVESAKTSLNYDEFGRMVMHIEHDLLKGITPEMVAWWFGNIGGDMDVEDCASTNILSGIRSIISIGSLLSLDWTERSRHCWSQISHRRGFRQESRFLRRCHRYRDATGRNGNNACWPQARFGALASQSRFRRHGRRHPICIDLDHRNCFARPESDGQCTDPPHGVYRGDGPRLASAQC
jgi:hypothetical protein